MNNLFSYCGLVDAKRRASDIALPVQAKPNQVQAKIQMLTTSYRISTRFHQGFFKPLGLEIPKSKFDANEMSGNGN